MTVRELINELLKCPFPDEEVVLRDNVHFLDDKLGEAIGTIYHITGIKDNTQICFDNIRHYARRGDSDSKGTDRT